MASAMLALSQGCNEKPQIRPDNIQYDAAKQETWDQDEIKRQIDLTWEKIMFFGQHPVHGDSTLCTEVAWGYSEEGPLKRKKIMDKHPEHELICGKVQTWDGKEPFEPWNKKHDKMRECEEKIILGDPEGSEYLRIRLLAAQQILQCMKEGLPPMDAR